MKENLTNNKDGIWRGVLWMVFLFYNTVYLLSMLLLFYIKKTLAIHIHTYTGQQECTVVYITLWQKFINLCRVSSSLKYFPLEFVYKVLLLHTISIIISYNTSMHIAVVCFFTSCSNNNINSNRNMSVKYLTELNEKKVFVGK